MLSLFWYLYVSFATLIFFGLFALDLSSVFSTKEKERCNPSKSKVLVIVPCKGLDFSLRENLLSFKNQDYKNYRVVTVLDSLADPAIKSIKGTRTEYIISNAKCEGCSGKVRAISTAIEKFRNFDVYVIADSDILVPSSWLVDLVTPLSDKKIGLSTMFPYFKPVKGFWSRVKMVWGFVGEGLLENKSSRFGWGGSMAFRKELLDKDSLNFVKNSRYSVSDDICITKITKRKGLGIAYVNTSRPVVNSVDNFKQFFEWSNRQTALTLLGYRRNLYYGIAFYLAEIITFVSGIVLTIFLSPIFIVFFAHYIKSVVISYKRARDRDPLIALVVLIMPFFYLLNLLVAARMKSITWRGREYKI